MPHKLLLADDSVTIQRVIELTFADEDILVVAVSDGKKAIANIQLDRPDIVLADIGMPEHDGYELAAFIKGHPELAHIPVLLLTGAFEPVDEARARSIGCDGVLVKPFEPQVVINHVKDLLAGRRPEGLWKAQAPAQSATPQPLPAAVEADVRGTAAQTVAASPARASLDDYFDRLDAAFASMEGGVVGSSSGARAISPGTDPRSVLEFDPSLDPRRPAAAVGRTADDLEGWDPDLSLHSAKPAPTGPRPSEPEAARDIAPDTPAAHATSVAPGHPSAAPMPALAEAFAMLLSAEQGRSVPPSGVPAAPPSDALVDDIVQRVINRMGDQVMRDAVLEVAERLVKQEIERIKAAGRV